MVDTYEMDRMYDRVVLVAAATAVLLFLLWACTGLLTVYCVIWCGKRKERAQLSKGERAVDLEAS